MVKFLRKKLFILLAVCLFLLESCNNDLLGILFSNDLDLRLKSKYDFVFLSDSDRSTVWGDDFSFIVISDTHFEDGKQFGFEKIKDVIEANGGEIKFIVMLGDITQNGRKKDIQNFIDTARTFGVPCYPVIGNHDVYFGNWPNWKNMIGSTRYRINSDRTTLFILDSANAFFGKAQLDWLEKELKSAEERVFVFTHSNIFATSNFPIQQFTDARERARIVSILKNRAEFMFMGHSHKRHLNETGGVKYLSINSFIDEKVYCLVTVKPHGISYSFEKL
jgi:3',5'-cyclic AMP phosphodiesterase CpdA